MKRLLIVDDEPAIAEVIESVAAGRGYEVTTTGDAEAFMAAAAALDPDVIVLDLSLPHTDGVELLRLLAESGCRARILIVSGFDERVLETSGRLGAALGLDVAGTLNKPIRVAELRSALARLEHEALL
ncbi:MAG TPA: response regulator [Allosphingosinicella sp.]|nr:response regulator [Allosphingosinicella sp.]